MLIKLKCENMLKVFFSFFCLVTSTDCEGFTCGLNGSCIRNSSVCDGWCDCDEDCSDELGCNCTTGFVCNNTQCLPWTEEIAFCDKIVDCLDGVCDLILNNNNNHNCNFNKCFDHTHSPSTSQIK